MNSIYYLFKEKYNNNFCLKIITNICYDGYFELERINPRTQKLEPYFDYEFNFNTKETFINFIEKIENYHNKNYDFVFKNIDNLKEHKELLFAISKCIS